MPVANPFDHPTAVAARASQSDPLVMYLIVRRAVETGIAELVAATVLAVVRADRVFREHPVYRDDMAAWRVASYRKVCLRANERDFARVLEQYDHTVGLTETGVALVAVLPARRRSAADAFLRRLQVLTGQIESLPQDERPGAISDGPTMVIARNPHIAMSVGKTLAQVGHVALMSADAPHEQAAGPAWEAAVLAWESAGYPVELVDLDVTGWTAARTTWPCVIAVDAGLTEIDPGTETMLATRPRWPAERSGRIWRPG